MDSDLGVEHGPERAVNGVTRRLADTEAAQPRPRLHAPRSTSTTGCATSSPGGAPSATLDRGGRARREPRMSRITVMLPWLGEEEIAAVTEVIESGWVAQGPRVAAFEEAFADASAGRARASRVSRARPRCTWRSIVAGVGPGDEVVVPSFSFIATANAAVYVGARPVFADVDPATGNLTAETVEAALTPAHPAVIAVDQGGVPVDLDADPRAVRPARHRRRRGRRLRAPARPTAAGRSGPAPTSPPGPSTRARSSPPARAACSPRRDADWADRGAAAARARMSVVGRRPARAACSRRPRATSRSASTTG